MSNVPNDSLYSTAYWRGLMNCAGIDYDSVIRIMGGQIYFEVDGGAASMNIDRLQVLASH